MMPDMDPDPLRRSDTSSCTADIYSVYTLSMKKLFSLFIGLFLVIPLANAASLESIFLLKAGQDTAAFDAGTFTNNITKRGGFVKKFTQKDGNTPFKEGIFLGGNASIDISNASTLNVNFPITIAAWIKTNKLRQFQGIISKGNGLDDYTYHFAITDQNKLGFFSPGTMWSISNIKIKPGQWIHVAMTLDMCDQYGENCTLKMYKNGLLGYTDSFVSAGTLNNNKVTIGNWANWIPLNFKKWGFRGTITHLAIYNKALDEVNIERLFNERESLE